MVNSDKARPCLFQGKIYATFDPTTGCTQHPAANDTNKVYSPEAAVVGYLIYIKVCVEESSIFGPASLGQLCWAF